MPDEQQDDKPKRELPAAMKARQFKPGKSGNPSGRPPGIRPGTSKLLSKFSQIVGRSIANASWFTEDLEYLKNEGLTVNELVAVMQMYCLATNTTYKNAQLLKTVYERFEGKIPLRILHKAGEDVEDYEELTDAELEDYIQDMRQRFLTAADEKKETEQDANPDNQSGLSGNQESAQTKLEARRLKSSYAVYFREAWKVLYPDVPFTESWHYDYVAECLQYAASGQMKKDYPTRRGLIINVPPRTLKSTEVNIGLPGFVWASHPEKKFLCISYGQELAVNEISTKRRKIVVSDWYTERFPKVRLVDDVNVKHRYDTTAGGYAIATTPGGFASGSGANIIIIDDIIKMSDESVYGADRENANNWYETEGFSRLNNQAEDFFIVVCQRLHEQDFPGFLNKTEPGLWWNIVIPQECEEDEDYVFPLSGKVYHRKKGEVLLPDRFPPHVIELAKTHPHRWAGQNQQKPMPATGNLCDPNKWLYFDSDNDGRALQDVLPSFDMVLLSVDASFKGTQKSDYCCVQKHGYTRASQYILSCDNRRMDEVELEATIINTVLDSKCPQNERPTILLIEEAANGPAIIQRLRKLPTPLPVAIVPINPEGGKLSRAMAAQPEQVAGNCFLPSTAPWVQAFKTQLALGPNIAENDDMIDSWSQGWTYRRSHRWGFYEALESKKSNTATAPPAPSPQERAEKVKDKQTERVKTWRKSSKDILQGLLRR